MFLPVEGLYAEVLRRAGLAEQIQRDFHVMIAGPTTLMAILSSLQMGFHTLAIEKRLKTVETLPDPEATAILQIAASPALDAETEDDESTTPELIPDSVA
jgi:hypothetical protein